MYKSINKGIDFFFHLGAWHPSGLLCSLFCMPIWSTKVRRGTSYLFFNPFFGQMFCKASRSKAVHFCTKKIGFRGNVMEVGICDVILIFLFLSILFVIQQVAFRFPLFPVSLTFPRHTPFPHDPWRQKGRCATCFFVLHKVSHFTGPFWASWMHFVLCASGRHGFWNRLDRWKKRSVVVWVQLCGQGEILTDAALGGSSRRG